MQMVKIRRVGNSNVVSLPREFEQVGFTAGTHVVLEALPSGALLLAPAEGVREHVRTLSRRAATKNRRALDILAAYDRDERSVPGQSQSGTV
jgi:antitoxin component of MazEF toxin-antitoxin module